MADHEQERNYHCTWRRATWLDKTHPVLSLAERRRGLAKLESTREKTEMRPFSPSDTASCQAMTSSNMRRNVLLSNAR